MTYSQVIILVIIGVLFIWAIVERVCKCIENRACYMALGQSVGSYFQTRSESVKPDPDEVQDIIKKIEEAGR